jgi:hypothetical protein
LVYGPAGDGRAKLLQPLQVAWALHAAHELSSVSPPSSHLCASATAYAPIA